MPDGDDWHSPTGLAREDFDKLTAFCNGAENGVDSRNRALALGLTQDDVRVATGCIVRVREPEAIGHNTLLGLYSYINGDVRIGANVLIGPHCSITSNNHIFDAGTGWFSGNEGEAIVIEDGCWLASGVMVTAGCTVGRCSLLCAHAVVTKDVPPYSIMAGIPARRAGEIDPDTGAYRWFKKEGA